MPDHVPQALANAVKPAFVLLKNLRRWIDQHMHGRYRPALAVALGLAFAGALAGLRLGGPQYRAQARLLVHPPEPAILKQIDQEIVSTAAVTEAFILLQTALLGSQRLIETAMNTPAWRSLGQVSDAASQKRFENNLRVSRLQDADAISIEFTAPDPATAAAGAGAAVEAYKSLCLEADPHHVHQRIELLRQRHAALSEELAHLRDKVRAIVQRFADDDLGSLQRARQLAIEEYRKELGQLQQIMRDAKAPVKDELAARQERLESRIEAAQAEVLELGQQRQEMARLSEAISQTKAGIQETSRRIGQLTLEAALAGRVSFALEAQQAPVPWRDTRRALVPAGGLLGLVLGFGFFLLLGMLGHRPVLVEVPEASEEDDLMTGLLPTLPHNLADPVQRAVTVGCLSPIRSMLRNWARQAGHQVFAVTSPVAGAGKTSLTLALGASFASANVRTLLIDCDLLASALTGRVDALSADAQPSSGLLDGAPAPHRPGLLDALAGENLDDCVAPTPLANLHLLPLGDPEALRGGTLAPAALHRLLEAARLRFDLILIDTAPILGSLEAAAIASIVDGALLIVAGPEQRSLAQQSVKYIQSLNARLVGVICNQFGQRDVLPLGDASACDDPLDPVQSEAIFRAISGGNAAPPSGLRRAS